MKISNYLYSVFVVVLLAYSSTSLAHNSLESSTPSAGESLSGSPKYIELTFTDATYLESVELSVGNAKQILLALDEQVSASRHFTVAVPELENGEYEVKWKVIGDDTHEITGAFVFAVGQKLSSSEAAHSSHSGH